MKATRFYLMIAVLSLISCSKEVLLENENTNKVSVELSANLEQQTSMNELTKTTLRGSTILWSAGDQLSLLSNGHNDCFTLKDGYDGQASGRFTGEATPAEKYFVLYPYSSGAAYDGTNITFSIPQTQRYNEGSFAPNTNVSIATTTDLSENLSFKNVFGVFKLSIKGTMTVNSVAIRDESGMMLWGDFTLADNGNVGTDAQQISAENGTNVLYMSFDEGVTLSLETATDFYFVAPAGAFTKGFTVHFYPTSNTKVNAQGALSSLKSNKNSIIRSKVREMPEATINNYGEYVDLSANGTANTYIAPVATQRYKFKPTKGNSDESVGDIASVAVLWETRMTTSLGGGKIMPELAYSDGYIKFKNPNLTEDAFYACLIAAYDDSSNVLWSWLIWSLSELPEYFVHDNMTIMSLNLGARHSSAVGAKVSNCGFLFQWGRKDPFPYADFAYNYYPLGGTEQFNKKNTLPVEAKEYDAQSSVAYSISHPDVFLKGSDNKWSYAGETDLWSNVTKTIYDPSPVGFRVPSCAELSIYTGHGSNPSGGSVGTVTMFGREAFCTGKNLKDNGSFNTSGLGHLRSAQGYGFNESSNILYWNGGTAATQMTKVSDATGLQVRCVKE